MEMERTKQSLGLSNRLASIHNLHAASSSLSKYGKIRPMWMGSRMGGILCDFRFIEPYVRTLQATTDNKYVVADYVWDDFGLSFVRFLTEAVNHEEALKRFTSNE